MKFFFSSLLLDKNFIYRFLFRYLGVFILLIVTPFLFIQSSEDLALFLIVRSAIRIWITFLNNYTGGQNFYRSLNKTVDVEIYFVGWFKNISFLIFIFASINIVLINVVTKNISYGNIIDFIDLIFIFLWFVSSALLITFSHYFQTVKNNFASGISQGIMGNIILLIAVLLFYIFYEINFTTVVFSFSISMTLSLLFNAVLFYSTLSSKSSLQNKAPIKSIFNIEYLYEGLSQSSPPIVIFLIITFSSYLYDANISSIIGMTFLLFNFIYFLPFSYQLSSRTIFFNYDKLDPSFKRKHNDYRKNLILIYLSLSVMLAIFIATLNLDFFKTMLIDIKIDSVILALKINLTYTVTYILVSMLCPRSILILLLYGKSKDVFKINNFALCISFAISLSIFILINSWLTMFIFFAIYEITKDLLIMRYLNNELIVKLA